MPLLISTIHSWHSPVLPHEVGTRTLRESAYSKIVFPGRDVCSRPSENTGDIHLSYQNEIHCLVAVKYPILITLSISDLAKIYVPLLLSLKLDSMLKGKGPEYDFTAYLKSGINDVIMTSWVKILPITL